MNLLRGYYKIKDATLVNENKYDNCQTKPSDDLLIKYFKINIVEKLWSNDKRELYVGGNTKLKNGKYNLLIHIKKQKNLFACTLTNIKIIDNILINAPKKLIFEKVTDDSGNYIHGYVITGSYPGTPDRNGRIYTNVSGVMAAPSDPGITMCSMSSYVGEVGCEDEAIRNSINGLNETRNLKKNWIMRCWEYVKSKIKKVFSK